MTKRFIRSARLLAVLCAAAAALILFGAVGVSAAGEVPAVYTPKDEPPFTVLADKGENGEIKIGCDLGIYKGRQKKYFLFLPSTADPRCLTVRYDGKKTAYDDATGKTVAPGETFTADLSNPSSVLYEYDEEYGVYDAYPFTVMQGGNLAAFYIELKDGDESLLRINSSQHTVETGEITVVEPDGSVTFDGALTRMKGHGLTSYEASRRVNTKNSYNINLGEKAELIEGAGRSKKWSLLRIRTWGEYDATGLSYVTAFSAYNALVKDAYFNLCSRFVDVYINGDYRGVYVLTERMDINGSMNVTDLEAQTSMPEGRIKQVARKKSDPAIAKGIESYSYAEKSSVPEGTDITGGYILEIMCGHYGECGFKTKQGMFVNIKSPAYPTQEMVQYVAGYVQDFENALFSETGYNDEGKHWTEYADVKSYAAQTLIYTFFLNWENYRTSTYMTKDKGGVLKFGPVWDFESGPGVMYDNTIFGVRFGYTEKQQYIWYQQAWKKGDYLHMIAELNLDLKDILDQMFGFAEPEDGRRVIRSLDEIADEVKPSHEMNWIRWDQPNTFDEWRAAMTEALHYRYDNWYNNVWSEKKSLIGLTAECADNGDGTWTLTATPYGRIDSDYCLWYEITDDVTKGTQFDSGNTVTVPAGGVYYASVTGPNNAYCQGAGGKIFASKSLTVYSNVITSPDDGPMATGITGSNAYYRRLDLKNGLAEATEVEVPVSAEPVKAEKTAEGSETPSSPTVRAAALTNAEWIVLTVGIVAVCGTMSAVTLSKKKGGRADAA